MCVPSSIHIVPNLLSKVAGNVRRALSLPERRIAVVLMPLVCTAKPRRAAVVRQVRLRIGAIGVVRFKISTGTDQVGVKFEGPEVWFGERSLSDSACYQLHAD